MAKWNSHTIKPQGKMDSAPEPMGRALSEAELQEVVFSGGTLTILFPRGGNGALGHLPVCVR